MGDMRMEWMIHDGTDAVGVAVPVETYSFITQRGTSILEILQDQIIAVNRGCHVYYPESSIS